MIVLVGFMGAGKTSLGRLLARKLEQDFWDADEAIEAATGRSIPEIFQTETEAGFRRIEAAQIEQLLAGPPGVLALGGGALSSAAVRDAVAGHQVVFLDISLADSLARVGSDPGRPMLARPDLAAVYAERQAWYRAAATITLPVGGRAPSRLVRELLIALGEPDVEE